jgi:hypothetical protein
VERAWLREFGATGICDPLEGPADSLPRSIYQSP